MLATGAAVAVLWIKSCRRNEPMARARATVSATTLRWRRHWMRPVPYFGDCACTHEGRIHADCINGIFGVDLGTHREYTPTGCEFDTLTLLAKLPRNKPRTIAHLKFLSTNRRPM